MKEFLFLGFLSIGNIYWVLCIESHIQYFLGINLLFLTITLLSNIIISFYRCKYWDTGRGKATWLRLQGISANLESPCHEPLWHCICHKTYNLNTQPNFHHYAKCVKCPFQRLTIITADTIYQIFTVYARNSAKNSMNNSFNHHLIP